MYFDNRRINIMSNTFEGRLFRPQPLAQTETTGRKVLLSTLVRSITITILSYESF